MPASQRGRKAETRSDHKPHPGNNTIPSRGNSWDSLGGTAAAAAAAKSGVQWIQIRLPMQRTGKIPQALEQLSPCTPTIEPTQSRARAPQQEKPLQ